MPKVKPTYTGNDCTVVLATIDARGRFFRRCVNSILANRPKKLVIVVPIDNALQLTARFYSNDCVHIVGSPLANKRLQQVCGLDAVETPITVFCDDDVLWPRHLLHYSLAVFEDEAVGAGGTCQRLLREKIPNVWEFLGAAYLERRNFEVSATTRIDGGISALSGRTQLVRTVIVKNKAFMTSYLAEKWLGYLPLQGADDDNFITRWMMNRNWRIRIQYCPEAEVLTTLHDCPRFLAQCIRWSRTTWRSNITSLFVERTVWRRQPWSTYALYLAVLNPPSIIMDGVLVWLLYRTVQAYMPNYVTMCMITFVFWLILTKTIKLIPHFHRHPADLRFLPAQLMFGYFHSLIKFYSLCTVGSTTWLGRDESFEPPDMTLENAVGINGERLLRLAAKSVGRSLELEALESPNRITRNQLAVKKVLDTLDE